MFSFFRRSSNVQRRRETVLRVERLEARELCAAMAHTHDHRRVTAAPQHGPVIQHTATSQTIRRVEKLHTLTLANLPAGSYSVSQHLRPAAVDHVLAHRR
jgi:hypothetical protein